MRLDTKTLQNDFIIQSSCHTVRLSQDNKLLFGMNENKVFVIDFIIIKAMAAKRVSIQQMIT